MAVENPRYDHSGQGAVGLSSEFTQLLLAFNKGACDSNSECVLAV